jgi:hypothetical protein
MPKQLSPAEINALEQALTALAPLPSAIDRDRLMYRAGQASSAGRRWPWPSATAVLAMAVAALGAVVIFRPEATVAPQAASAEKGKVRVVEKIVYVKVPAPAPAEPKSTPPASTSSEAPAEDLGPVAFSMGHFQLQNQLLRWGLDGLELRPIPSARQSPVPVDPLLDTRASSGRLH